MSEIWYLKKKINLQTADYYKYYAKINKMEYIKFTIATVWGITLGFLIPVADFMMLCGLLVVIDFITGVLAAKKRKEPLRSKGFQRTITKIVLYFLAILLSRGMDVVFLYNVDFKFSFTYIVAGFVCLTEFKSNLENIGVLTGTDIWKHIASRIPKILRVK